MPAPSPAVMTYNSLLTSLYSYAERKATDTEFTDEIPKFILFTEQRIASALKNLGFQSVVTGNFQVGRPDYAKPAFWRDPISLTYVNSNGEYTSIFPRLYEFCRQFWPKPSLTDAPRYYADYNFDNILVVPTPDVAYVFEWIYYCRLTPLALNNQTNWLTVNAPQLLFYGCMFEYSMWAKNPDKITQWGGLFESSLKDLQKEQMQRLADRTTVATQG